MKPMLIRMCPGSEWKFPAFNLRIRVFEGESVIEFSKLPHDKRPRRRKRKAPR